ncbi:MAG: hypothetical protein QOJ95_12 [Mycobacterium sp.]|nr:hypothetical protein [Mycobacterium sp.]
MGIIGAGGWAKYGHMPALQSLDDFEITAVAARRRESAESAAAQFGIPTVYDDPQALIDDPNVDLVVVMPPTSERVRFVKAVIAAGKDVYSEWPLATTTKESEELLALAEAKGVRHVIGLQRRLGPSARYARDLLKQGYVGRIRAARISVGTDAFPPVRSANISWTFDVSSFTNVLSIYAGHHLDTLFQIVGFPSKLTAIVENQFPAITVEETGDTSPTTTPMRSWSSALSKTAGCSPLKWKAAKPIPPASRSTSPEPRASCGSPTTTPSRTATTTLSRESPVMAQF